MIQTINSNIDVNWPGLKVEFNKPISLFIDSFYKFNINKNDFKILWIKEAEEISGFRDMAIENHKNFDVILTYDEKVLKECKNAVFMPFGTTWINEYDLKKEKKFQISHLVGHKEITPLHLLRKKIYYKQSEIKNPIDFYISKYGGVENVFNNIFLGDSKNPLFDSQFHICIENSKQKNYFTEKVIDCFITKTIPVYCGCENIQDFFNIKGFFVAKNFDEIIKICNSLNKDDYEIRKEFIEDNFNRAKKYSNLIESLENTIKKILIKYYENNSSDPSICV